MDNKSSGGMSLVGVLTVVFIVLKMCKLISWSWVWVLSPLWISIVVIVLIVILLNILDR